MEKSSTLGHREELIESVVTDSESVDQRLQLGTVGNNPLELPQKTGGRGSLLVELNILLLISFKF
jgi:hypothetical protein